MTTSDPHQFASQRRQVAAELRRIRQRAGLSTYQIAGQLGISQSNVSKIENGRISVSVPNARAWGRAAGLDGEELERLVERAELARTEVVTRRSVARRGGFATKQRQFGALEATARTILNFQPTGVPGLLQVAAYAHSVFARRLDEHEAAAAVAARIARQELLYDGTRRFDFVLTEQVVRWRFGPLAAHLAQLDTTRRRTWT